MLPTIGLITEGETDQHVLKHILIGYFNDPDLVVRNLQPAADETDADSMSEFGGWVNVFNYCQPEFLEGALKRNDFVVIQVDTDVSEQKGFDVSKLDENSKRIPVLDLISRVIERFQQIFLNDFDKDFFEENNKRILFAISVDSIECWLLPLFYSDNTQNAINNCLFKVNDYLIKNKERPIPENKKGAIPTYRKLSKPFMKNKVLIQSYPQNPSFKFFIENELNIKIPSITEGS